MADRSFKLGVAGAVLAALSLQGCTDFKRAVGWEKVIPDEFAVVSRAPLAIPPDYTLRPPRPGAQRPQEKAPTEQARETVFRAGQQEATLPPPATQRSSGEGELLREAGAANALSNIRELVNVEATADKPIDEGFVDKLLFWRTSAKKVAPADEVIDPEKETERLHDRQAAGKAPPNPGTPSIERTSTPSLFERLF